MRQFLASCSSALSGFDGAVSPTSLGNGESHGKAQLMCFFCMTMTLACGSKT